MKYILMLGFILPVACLAQDCKLIKDTDPFTKLTKLSTGFILLTGGSVTVDADSKEIDFLFSIDGDDQCFDNNGTAVISFENTKVKSTFRNGGTLNCEGLFHFIFKNTASTNAQLKKLVTQKITQIVFTGNNKKKTTITLDTIQQQKLQTFWACLAEDAKGLIK